MGTVGEKGFFYHPKKTKSAPPRAPFYLGVLKMRLWYGIFLRNIMPPLLSKESFLKQWGHITSLNRSDLCVESKIKGDLGGTLQSFSLVYSHVITGINQDDSRSFLKKDFCSKIAAEVILKRRKKIERTYNTVLVNGIPAFENR